RTYFGRQRDAVEASQLLERSGNRINHATPAFRGLLQAEQALKMKQQELEKLKLKNKPRRSYEPSM
ncbi:hypothetical protein, partial [Xenorhabdus bovienii]|uniref:hypothetical protein n=1 Tax=Xenorhabdus bovienii TaxID=40576 RepID=UPI00301BBA5A